MCVGLTKEWLNSCRAWITASQDAYNSLLVMERLRDIAVKQHKTVVYHILSPVASLLTRYCITADHLLNAQSALHNQQDDRSGHVPEPRRGGLLWQQHWSVDLWFL